MNLINHNYRCFITNQSYMRFTQLYSEILGMIIMIINMVLILKMDHFVEISLAAYGLSASINTVTTSSIATKDMLELSSLMFSPQHLLEYLKLETENNNSLKKAIIPYGKIEFKNIFLKYQPQLPTVLHDFTLQINPGERIGIFGRTGSGKSSIIHMLCRLTEPLSGTVFIDDQDYKDFGLYNLRSLISVIPQSSVLFSTSIRDNLDPIKLFTDDDIWRVLKLVKLDSLIHGNEHGLDTQLGDDGLKLSAGQKQLLCFSRAILRKNKIVLLDEATSNVDMKTDEFIKKIIKSEFRDSTLIIIAHRILTAADSDKIAVMDYGECVEFDTPLNLFDKEEGHFKKLAENAGLKREHFLYQNRI